MALVLLLLDNRQKATVRVVDMLLLQRLLLERLLLQRLLLQRLLLERLLLQRLLLERLLLQRLLLLTLTFDGVGCIVLRYHLVAMQEESGPVTFPDLWAYLVELAGQVAAQVMLV